MRGLTEGGFLFVEGLCWMFLTRRLRFRCSLWGLSGFGTDVFGE